MMKTTTLSTDVQVRYVVTVRDTANAPLSNVKIYLYLDSDANGIADGCSIGFCIN